jgi:cardiolipin synthase
MDMRSFEDNFEVSALIYNRRIASELEASFKNDLKRSRRITLDRWEQRSRWNGMLESLARLLSPLL